MVLTEVNPPFPYIFIINELKNYKNVNTLTLLFIFTLNYQRKTFIPALQGLKNFGGIFKICRSKNVCWVQKMVKEDILGITRYSEKAKRENVFSFSNVSFVSPCVLFLILSLFSITSICLGRNTDRDIYIYFIFVITLEIM